MSRTKNPLAAPQIPAAHFDGLINTSDLSRPIAVKLPVWGGSAVNDIYQLVINGKATGPMEAILPSTSVENPELTLWIRPDRDLLETGCYAVSYKTISYPGLNTALSPSTALTINLKPPGAALIAPIIFATANFEDSLSGRIPGYSGMAIGDVVRVLCNDTAGPSLQVSAEHFESPIMIQIEGSFLTALGSAEVIVEYLITDRAGNTSAKSHPISITLQI
jgi:hypothetical protein